MFGASSRHDRVFYEGFERHAERLVAAAKVALESLRGPQDRGDGAGRFRDEVRDIRENADHIARDLICELRKTWITPFDPQDMRTLIVALDDAVEIVSAAVERLTLFQPSDGRGERPQAQRLAELLVRSAEGLHSAVKLMGEKRQDAEVLKICGQLRHLAREADDLYRQAVAELYAVGGGRSELLDVIKWQEVFGKLEEAVGGCGRVALEIETIVEGHA